MILSIRFRLRLPFALLLLPVAVASFPGCDQASLGRRRQTIVVETHSPWTDARTVRDAITMPIEQQLLGVPKTMVLRSRSGSDGSCRITLTFEPGVDTNEVQSLLRERVKDALPVLPEAVQREGVKVKKGSAGICLILFLSSPNGSVDQRELSNYANQPLRDALTRVAGIAEVTLVGSVDKSVRIWLDPDRLASLELAAIDVVNALARQNPNFSMATSPDQPGGLFVLQEVPSGLARLPIVEELNDLVVLAKDGRDIRLRDVARVELGAARSESRAQFDGKRGVALVLHSLPLARPRDVSAAVQQVTARLVAELPKGHALEIAFDFTANLEAAGATTSPPYVLVDMDAPSNASAKRKLAMLERADQALRLGNEGGRVLSLTENIFDRLPDKPCLLVRLPPTVKKKSDIEKAIEATHDQLAKRVAEPAFCVRNLSRPRAFPDCGYVVDFAVYGPETDQVRSVARRLAERLRESKKLTDVRADAAVADPTDLQLDFDAEAAKLLGVAQADVTNVLQVHFGSGALTSSEQDWQVKLPAGGESRDHARDVMRLQVRNSRDEMVPMSRVVVPRERTGAGIEERLNGCPMVEITANPAAGVRLAEIGTLCETLAKDVCVELRLAGDYRLMWLNDPKTAW